MSGEEGRSPIRPRNGIKHCMDNSGKAHGQGGVLYPIEEGTEEEGREGRKRARAEVAGSSRE